MKRRVLSILLIILLIAGTLPMTAMAATGTWDVDLNVTENTEKTYNGQNTLEVAFGVQSDNLTLETAQSVCFAVDLRLFDLINYRAELLTGVSSDLSGNIGSRVCVRTDSTSERDTWRANAYYAVSADQKTGYIVLQPYFHGEDVPCTKEINLASILLGFKEGKSKADLAANSIRYMSLSEAKSFCQTEVVSITDGFQNTQKYRHNDGISLGVTPQVDWGVLLNADKTIELLSITKNPNKTTYIEGEVFDPTGMVVNATYSDGTTEEVTGYDVLPSGALKMEDSYVTVSFEGKTAKVLITVNENKANEEVPESGVTTTANPFTDVSRNDWFFDSVMYVYENGLMTGMTSNTFGPNGTMTRAMVWTVLGRMAGETFRSTGAEWYDGARTWAKEAGVSDGLNPNGPITRQELVTMLWRYVGSPKTDVSVLDSYKDGTSVSSWARESMAWAVNESIMEGSDGNLNPQAAALRCQVAAILMRYCK